MKINQMIFVALAFSYSITGITGAANAGWFDVFESALSRALLRLPKPNALAKEAVPRPSPAKEAVPRPSPTELRSASPHPNTELRSPVPHPNEARPSDRIENQKTLGRSVENKKTSGRSVDEAREDAKSAINGKAWKHPRIQILKNASKGDWVEAPPKLTKRLYINM
jgi:hypothetical protein